MKIIDGQLCPYCQSPIEEISNSKIYGGTEYGIGLAHACTRYPYCDSYVNLYKDQNPGIPANKHLRDLRIKCHNAIDKLWKYGVLTRTEVYNMLAFDMDIKNPHIASFNVDQCKKLLSIY